MPRKSKPPPDDPAQSKRFADMTREIDADATPEDFERAFKKAVTNKRAPSTVPKAKPKPDGKAE